MEASAVCAALADESRLRVFGAIAAEPTGISAGYLAADKATMRAAERLLRAGLVERSGERYRARPEVFRQAMTVLTAPPEPLPGAASDVAALFRHGRLTAMPRAGGLRTRLLRYLSLRFEPGRAYSEPELRRVLEPVWADHVALRRYLVDEGILVRDLAGQAYQRATVPV
jgi:hypothetical protein